MGNNAEQTHEQTKINETQTGATEFNDLPPISQTLSLKPSCIKDLILKPWVGMIWEISSSDNFFNMVVFPELSKPSTRRRASWSDYKIK